MNKDLLKLDMEVSKKIFNQEVTSPEPYTTSIAASFKLIDWLSSQKRAVILQNDTHELNKVWYVRNFDIDSENEEIMSRGWHWKSQALETEASTLPLAIVQFVLEARSKGFV